MRDREKGVGERERQHIVVVVVVVWLEFRFWVVLFSSIAKALLLLYFVKWGVWLFVWFGVN